MRVLLLGLNFAPELVGIGKYTGELAAFLHDEGIDLRVVTAPPYYPDWQVQPGYSSWTYRRERANGMRVYRCPLWVPRKPSGLGRLIHLFSFALSSLPVMLLQVLWKPDLVFCVVPTLFCAPSAWLAAQLSGGKCWLHIQDFELDAALNLGMLPGSKFLGWLARRFEGFVLQRFDRVSTISSKMLERVQAKGVGPDRVALLPNWADTARIFPLPGDLALRAELHIPLEKKIVLYHGSIGRKQGLEIVVDAASRLQQYPDILFLICGEGGARLELEERAHSLPNVRFIGLQPEERLNELVNLADLHVLPQRAGAADLVMPSKLTTMLASGKPVLASAQEGTELWRVASAVGKVIPPENADAMAVAILGLMDNPVERRRLGELGRNYTCQFLEKAVILSGLQKAIMAFAHRTN